MAASCFGGGQYSRASALSHPELDRTVDSYACVSDGRSRTSTLAQKISAPDFLPLLSSTLDSRIISDLRNRMCVRCSSRSPSSVGSETLATPQLGRQALRGRDGPLCVKSGPCPDRELPLAKMCHAENIPSATAGDAGLFTFSKRAALAAGASLFVLMSFGYGMEALAASGDEELYRLQDLLVEATAAWERGLDPSNLNRFQELYRACDLFDQIVASEPQRTDWLEARGQVEVDAKRFDAALGDFNEALRRNPSNYRAYASRALAYEGLARWDMAVEDYSEALRLGQEATGGGLEPYVMNSRGNAYASRGLYSEALRDYDESVKGFQSARELDGAIYAAGNAALTRIQLGEEEEGLKGLAAVARRAPGSIDMRAALAAIYWSQGKEQLAEEEWRFACDNINPGMVFDGCAKYKDQDWLRRIRRWPPLMADKMENFLKLRSSPKL